MRKITLKSFDCYIWKFKRSVFQLSWFCEISMWFLTLRFSVYVQEITVDAAIHFNGSQNHKTHALNEEKFFSLNFIYVIVKRKNNNNNNWPLCCTWTSAFTVKRRSLTKYAVSSANANTNAIDKEQEIWMKWICDFCVEQTHVYTHWVKWIVMANDFFICWNSCSHFF